MKKYVLIPLLVLILLLAACQQQPAPTEGSTPSTEPTQATVPSTQATQPSTEATEPPTQATEPALQLPDEGTPMDEKTLAWFQTMFTDDLDPYAVHPTNWYNMILGTQFDSPENINLRELFYNGIGWGRTVTEEEKNYLQSQGFDLHFDIAVVPLEEANEVLLYFFGLTWEETNGVGADSWTFYDETQCYYKMTSDHLSCRGYEIVGGAELPDGTIRLYYTLDYPGKEDMVFAITMVSKASELKEGYRILSNLPVE